MAVLERQEVDAVLQGGLGAGIIALNPTDACTLDIRGSSGLIRVNGGVVVVDSNHPTAACRSGNPTIDVAELQVVGGGENGLEESVTGNIFTGADFVPDPLAALPEPNEPLVNHGDVRVNNNRSETLQPGTYEDIIINGGDVVFERGLYYINGEFRFNGGTLDGTAGVMLFISPDNQAEIDVAGNGTFNLVGLTPISYPQGPAVPASVANIEVPIFQSRSNTNTAEFNGTADWQIGGTIYVPAAELLLRGTPGTFANGLIADTIQLRGTQDLVIDFDEQFEALPRSVFLVE